MKEYVVAINDTGASPAALAASGRPRRDRPRPVYARELPLPGARPEGSRKTSRREATAASAPSVKLALNPCRSVSAPWSTGPTLLAGFTRLSSERFTAAAAGGRESHHIVREIGAPKLPRPHQAE